ncbi:MAG: hypothetical protein CMM52_09805 [Rhodospirillaceae bacterium]|nr:hypothetical protein [Rhodospirillaceae bacterium]|tara:strand:+ start:802 stop:1110 length:309 start_codon:yes stop_codon:yes gene_type:complete
MKHHSKRGDLISISAVARRDPIASILLIRHGRSATYYTSWTTTQGRNRKAHNVLLWKGIEELKKQNVRWLDLGGLNTDSASGVARFKLGMGGEVTTLSGTYL